MNVDKRLPELEAKHKPKPILEWTEEELQFIADVKERLKKSGSVNYHSVCNPDEFRRMQSLSIKQGLMMVKDMYKK